MKKIIAVLKQENMESGYLYFYIHLVTEIVCFFTLSKLVGNSAFLWLAPLIYDALAFVPQSLIGYISDKYPKICFGLIGCVFLLLGFVVFNISSAVFLSLILICIGNACIHINGAEVTLRSSNGNLSHCAIFVSGGSFGVIIGKLLGKINLSFIIILILFLTVIPFIMLAEYYRKESLNNCNRFQYHNRNISLGIIVFLAVLVVSIRGYMGYGIPTSWNKTAIQTILLYSFMGIGKALGGILSDAFGIRKIANLSTFGSLPFLLFGDNFMIISLIGVMFFSMTMSITLAILTSALKNTPGLAFGWTTIGLFLGTVPIFFIRFSNLINCSIIVLLTIICTFILNCILREEKNE